MNDYQVTCFSLVIHGNQLIFQAYSGSKTLEFQDTVDTCVSCLLS